MLELTCPKCGMPIQWHDDTPPARCPACRAELTPMASTSEAATPKAADPRRVRGTDTRRQDPL